MDDIINRITQLQKKIRELTAEFRRLLQAAEMNEQQTLLLVKKIQQYQDYARRIHILGAQIDRLKSQNKALDQDARKIRSKFADGIAYEQRQQNFGMITILMGVQIQNLRQRVNQRQIHLDQMRTSILEPIRKI